jgi:hypothetical protein
MAVHTGTYRYVPVRTLPMYVPVRTFCKFSHDGTYRYVPVQTKYRKYVRVRTSTYFALSITVHGSTWQYMTVHGNIYHGLWQYMTVHCSTMSSLSRFMVVHGGAWQYMNRFVPRGGPAHFDAHLQALICMHIQWPSLQVIACTNRFIHHLTPMPEPSLTRAAPFSLESLPCC